MFLNQQLVLQRDQFPPKDIPVETCMLVCEIVHDRSTKDRCLVRSWYGDLDMVKKRA
jgi:hypothetical protein